MAETNYEKAPQYIQVNSAFELLNATLKRLADFDLTPSAKLVLLYLISCANFKQNNTLVFPSVSNIVNSIGITKQSVINATKKLQEGCFIEKQKRKGSNRNNYFLRSEIIRIDNATKE